LVKVDKIAEQAGQVVESIVDSNLKALGGRSGRKRGIPRPLLGLVAVAGGAAAFYAQADEQQREQASRKLSELADQVRTQVGTLTG